jgi:hypothetical protein
MGKKLKIHRENISIAAPRVNLAILSWREWVSKNRPEMLTWKLPIEILLME